jgi:hypothetical protein
MRIIGAAQAAHAAARDFTSAKQVRFPPGQWLGQLIKLVRVSCAAIMAAQVPLVLPFAAATQNDNGSSSSSRSSDSQSSSAALGQQAPFIASLLLTALKCTVCMRMQCPVQALHVAMAVSGVRVLPLGTPASPAQQQMFDCSCGSFDSFAAAMLSVNDPAAIMRGMKDPDMLPRQLRRVGAIAKVEVLATEEPLEFTPGGGNSSNTSSGSSSIGQQTEQGSTSTSTNTSTGSSSSSAGQQSEQSSNSAAGVWYSDVVAATMVLWLTTAARSMWLIGQVVSELQTGSSRGSSSSSGGSLEANSSSQQDLLSAWELPRVLEVAVAAVEWIGSELWHMRLPGDVVPDSSSSDSASAPLLLDLLEQHLQQQQAVHAAAKRCVAAAATAPADCGIRSAAVRSYLQHVWGPDVALQLRAFGAAVAAALPISWACNNAACTNLAKLSELQLVTGKAKVCSGCKHVRMCSAECHKQHWKAGHKKVCKKLAATGAATALPATAGFESADAAAAAADSTSDSSSSGNSSTANAAAAVAAAAAGLELPASAAAAAALPVRQLKSLLAALGVAGLAGAVEKSDLVALLVGALGLQ